MSVLERVDCSYYLTFVKYVDISDMDTNDKDYHEHHQQNPHNVTVILIICQHHHRHLSSSLIAHHHHHRRPLPISTLFNIKRRRH